MLSISIQYYFLINNGEPVPTFHEAVLEALHPNVTEIPVPKHEKTIQSIINSTAILAKAAEKVDDYE